MNIGTSKVILFEYLALFVKDFVAGTQLQKVQAFRATSGWIYAFEAFPSPRRFFLAATFPRDEELKKADLAKNLKPGENPLLLYLRAHVQNLRLEESRWQPDLGRWTLTFRGDISLEFHWKEGKGEVEIRVPDRKVFRHSLWLADWPSVEEIAEKPSDEDSALPAREEKKYQQLLKRVEADRSEAQAFLDEHQEILLLLEKAPQNWGAEGALGPRSLEVLNTWLKKGKLSRYARSTLGEAQDIFFKLKRRMTRKLAKAEERLREIQAENPYLNARPLRDQKKLSARIEKKKKESRFPGIKVPLEDGLLAYVGRSASENAELFRRMRDRDLWFHVRAEKGAHVWIPRGQKGLPARGDPHERVLQYGAQLALLNSRADKSGAATVDYTERRYLKATPGSDGLLRIERSETIFVRKDEAFEKRIFHK